MAYRNVNRKPLPYLRQNAIDIHDQLNNIIRAQSDNPLSITSSTDVAQSFENNNLNPDAQSPAFSVPTEDYSFFFDSMFSTSGNRSNGEIGFNLTPMNDNAPLSNIVRITLNEFYFPTFSDLTGFPRYYFYRNVFMNIKEMTSRQSTRMLTGQSYHFDLQVDESHSIAVKLRPKDASFVLPRPYKSIDTLTFQFLIPGAHTYIPVPLPLDYCTVQAVMGTNPAQFTILNTTTADIADIGATSVAVFFTGFLTGVAVGPPPAPAQPALDAQVNSARGYLIDNVINASTFSVSALSFLTLTLEAPICYMVIGKNRIGFTATFTCIPTDTRGMTNGIVAVHM